ncbi:MAG: glycosyltransferase family 9 protein [Acetobacteraceae bacterium]
MVLKRMRARVKSVLPRPVVRVARDGWENFRDWIDALAFGLSFVVARKPRPAMLIYFGFSPGDDLLCTSIMQELRKRGKGPALMVSNHRGLFAGRPDAAYVHPLWRRYDRHGSTISICRRFARIWGGRLVRPEYAPPLDADHSTPPSRHIIAEMCARAGIAGPVAVRPYLLLTEEERARARFASGRIVIQSSGMAAHHPIANKQWPVERFQGVVDALEGELSFIQLGSVMDPPLRGAEDFRGATGIREAAAILSEARLFVGTVGFLMHLARAVECPSVIIFGGREAPWQSGYICNANLYSPVPCAPCWRWNGCEFARKCMDKITVGDVVAAIRQMMARPRGPLAVETVEIADRTAPDERGGPDRLEPALALAAGGPLPPREAR